MNFVNRPTTRKMVNSIEYIFCMVFSSSLSWRLAAILEFPYIVNFVCNTYRLFLCIYKRMHERAPRKTDGAAISVFFFFPLILW